MNIIIMIINIITMIINIFIIIIIVGVSDIQSSTRSSSDCLLTAAKLGEGGDAAHASDLCRCLLD